MTLLLVSLAFAVVLVLAFKEPVGQILGKAIHPLSQLNEYLVLLGIIILMVSIASSVPSIILSSYSPVNIIKGEARYKDKILYGKIFIAIAGFLSIAALSICLAITSQTRHLINQELGYETEGVVFVRFDKNDQHLYLDEQISADICPEFLNIATTVDGVLNGLAYNIITASQPNIIKCYSQNKLDEMQNTMRNCIKFLQEL